GGHPRRRLVADASDTWGMGGGGGCGDRGVNAATASVGVSLLMADGREGRARNMARMRSDCSRHSAMMTIALKAGVADEEIPRNTTVLSRVAMSRAPIAAPVMLNFPPAREVPPMTTARIASISS